VEPSQELFVGIESFLNPIKTFSQSDPDMSSRCSGEIFWGIAAFLKLLIWIFGHQTSIPDSGIGIRLT
jgi:hypothetical protein